MLLKIEVGGREKYFSFEGRKKVSIGSSQQDDLRLKIKGVLQRQVVVTEEQCGYFAASGNIDAESYLNEQRLLPDQKIPFTSYFPIRLADEAYLYLVDEATAQVIRERQARRLREEQEKERELETLDRAGPQERIYIPKNKEGDGTRDKIAVKRKKIAVQAPGARPKSKVKGNLAFVFIAVVLAGFTFWYQQWREGLKQVGSAAVKTSGATTNSSKPRSAPKKPEFGPKEAVGILQLDKCLGDYEANLCAPLKKLRELSYYEGFFKISNRLYLGIDLSAFGKGVQDIEYTEDEVVAAKNMAAMILRRDYRESEFEKADLRHKTISVEGTVGKSAALFTDLAWSGLLPELASSQEVKSLHIVLFKDTPSNYVGHVKLDKKNLEKLAQHKDLPLLLKLLWRSGFERPLQELGQELDVEKPSGLPAW